DSVVMKFTNFECESYNKSWFVFHNCRLKAVSRNRIVLNMNGSVLHPVSVCHVHAKVDKKANGYKPWILDFQIDACRFLRKNYNPVAKIVYNLFRDFSNLNHTCPYMGPQIIQGFYLRPELLKLPFPTGEYRLSLRFFLHLKHQFDTNVSFAYVEDLLNS
ncbi:hypothetical protein KR067_008686, partial [Drosophila pandora]